MKSLILILIFIPFTLYASWESESRQVIQKIIDEICQNRFPEKVAELHLLDIKQTEDGKIFLYESFQAKRRFVYSEDYNSYILSDVSGLFPKEAEGYHKECELTSFNSYTDDGRFRASSYLQKKYTEREEYADDAVKVGVIDVGFDLAVDDVAAFVLRDENNNFSAWNINSSLNEIFADSHGNHVSGIVSRKNPEIALILASTVEHNTLSAGPASSYSLKRTPLLNWYQAIITNNELKTVEYVASKGARIINMSFGVLVEEGRLLPEGYANAAFKYPEILFVFGAGNDYKNIDEIRFLPASIEASNKISVASVNDVGDLSSFSNWGPISVDLATQGEGILSNCAPSGLVTDRNKCETIKSGTSMAAPKISHFAARILYANPTLKIKELKDILCKSVVKTPDLMLKTRCGGYFSEEVLEKTLRDRDLVPIK